MRKSYNYDGTFVNTGLLRDHVYKLREQKRLAARLRETVVAMRNMGDPTEAYQYNPILRDADRLIEYFDRMGRVLNQAESEAIQLSHQLGARIDNATDQIHQVSAENFML